MPGPQTRIAWAKAKQPPSIQPKPGSTSTLSARKDCKCSPNGVWFWTAPSARSEEHTSELQSLMRISYAVFCLKKNNNTTTTDQCKLPTHKHQHITNTNQYDKRLHST